MRPSAKVTILSTFRQLIQNRSLDKITVTEICEKSAINRQTFYNHFSDLFDIFKYLFQEELSEEIAQNRTFEKWCGGFLATLNYLKCNSRMILNVYQSSYRSEADLFFINISYQLLDRVVDECMNNMHVDLIEPDCRFIVNFYRHVFNGLMIDWVNEGMKEAPEDMLRKLQLMIGGSIPRSVQAFADEEKLHWWGSLKSKS
ncbi:TetR/AcrR family transcriptional regulator [Fusibacter ferrireducens]|uniref:TetR/AcrR family transcriptional regulator C-terminal domain-containing protein n=1 Tax=Fusibacter ferrireducens TaxID=2785058 RepID=A0ABR9ZW50_9FIRM|nr:TetR/AcrR family transcriptional regulator [Fusibacter ferrireducens]MBF4694670.1 TetR/AcrR family transcriptional regulator C-terminal domain-containing protein [Fusibacter ferrireducens]